MDEIRQCNLQKYSIMVVYPSRDTERMDLIDVPSLLYPFVVQNGYDISISILYAAPSGTVLTPCITLWYDRILAIFEFFPPTAESHHLVPVNWPRNQTCRQAEILNSSLTFLASLVLQKCPFFLSPNVNVILRS